MKKLLVLLLALMLVGCLAACQETTPTEPRGTTTAPTTTTTPPTTGHTHSYTETVTAPTCTEGGYTTYTCKCGDTYQANDTEALGHDYENYVCQRCNHEIRPSEGLEYTLSEDGSVYSVTDIGSCTDTDVVIPAEYNGLPVTSIGQLAFSDCSLTSIHFEGTMEQWNAITKVYKWNSDTGYTIYCTDGEIKK